MADSLVTGDLNLANLKRCEKSLTSNKIQLQTSEHFLGNTVTRNTQKMKQNNVLFYFLYINIYQGKFYLLTVARTKNHQPILTHKKN